MAQAAGAGNLSGQDHTLSEFICRHVSGLLEAGLAVHIGGKKILFETLEGPFSACIFSIKGLEDLLVIGSLCDDRQ